jgi:hypothetical protein
LIDEAAKQVCELKDTGLDKKWCTIANTIASLVTVVKDSVCGFNNTDKNGSPKSLKTVIEEFNLCQTMKFTVNELKVLTTAVCKINSPDADTACRYLKLITTCMENVQDFVCEQK